MSNTETTLPIADARPPELPLRSGSPPGLSDRAAKRFVNDLHKLSYDQLGTLTAYTLHRMADMKR